MSALALRTSSRVAEYVTAAAGEVVTWQALSRHIFGGDATEKQRAALRCNVSRLRHRGWQIGVEPGRGVYCLAPKPGPARAANTGSSFISSRIINCLRAARGGIVSEFELGEYCYGTAAWPGEWQTSLRMMIHWLRRQGWPIVNIRGRGYRYEPMAALVLPPAPRTADIMPRFVSELFPEIRARHAARRAAMGAGATDLPIVTSWPEPWGRAA